MNMSILAVGRPLQAPPQSLIDNYQKRLVGRRQITWQLIGPGSVQEESDKILSRIYSDAWVVLLDERGQEFDNKVLAENLETWLGQHSNIVIVIGGAHGVSEAVRSRANIVWSLSKLVLPHELIRIVLVEQLYRSQAISAGHPYHHE